MQIWPIWGVLARILQLFLLLGYRLLSWAKLMGRWLRGQATPDRFFGTWWGLIQVRHHLVFMSLCVCVCV